MKISRYLLLGPLVVALSTLTLPAQTSQAPASADTPAHASAGVADIIKMLDAHVSPDVIKAYVEASPAAFDVTPTDVITLKDHNANDDVTVALLKHNATLNAPAAAPAQSAAAPNQAQPPVRTYVINTGRLDPESYDFFQKYYLMPRTQAYVNQTLGYASVPYGDTFVPYYPPGIYSYGGYNGVAGISSGVSFGIGGRNPFNVGPGLRGGYMIHR